MINDKCASLCSTIEPDSRGHVKDIYDELVDKHKFVAIIGDMNDTPESAPLAALTRDAALKDISVHPSFDDGGRPGTFGNGTASN